MTVKRPVATRSERSRSDNAFPAIASSPCSSRSSTATPNFTSAAVMGLAAGAAIVSEIGATGACSTWHQRPLVARPNNKTTYFLFIVQFLWLGKFSGDIGNILLNYNR